MMNRYFYKSAVKDFVRASEETIFGQIAMKDEGDSGAEQKYAWSEEIDIIYHGVPPRYRGKHNETDRSRSSNYP